jgi:hypothetical protein
LVSSVAPRFCCACPSWPWSWRLSEPFRYALRRADVDNAHAQELRAGIAILLDRAASFTSRKARIPGRKSTWDAGPKQTPARVHRVCRFDRAALPGACSARWCTSPNVSPLRWSVPLIGRLRGSAPNALLAFDFNPPASRAVVSPVWFRTMDVAVACCNLVPFACQVRTST